MSEDQREQTHGIFDRGQQDYSEEAQTNGVLSTPSPFEDPRYSSLRNALPEFMRDLFDNYISSLFHPKSRE